MSDEKLLPPGVYQKEDQKEQDLKAMQEEADRKGLLLPAHMNRTGKKQTQQADDENVLLPIGAK